LLYAQLLLQSNDPAAAQAQIAKVSAASQQDPQVQAISAKVKQALEQNALPPLPKIELRIKQNPSDLEARLAYAEHCIAHKAWEQAFEQLLEIVRKDRAFQDDIGRKKMIEAFGLASTQPDLVSHWRRQLGSVLF
jgi:putative thioredoxin